MISHEYAQPVNDGTIGFGTQNAFARFDNVSIRGGAILPYIETFNDGEANFFAPQRGEWQANDGEYTAAPLAVGHETVSLLSTIDPLPGHYGLGATVTGRDAGARFYTNGVFIFDYVNARDFKFAGIYLGGDKFKIGHFNGKKWLVYALAGQELDTDTPYDLDLHIEGSVATLSQGGVVKLVHDFDEPLNDGRVGLGTQNAATDFDDFSLESLQNGSGSVDLLGQMTLAQQNARRLTSLLGLRYSSTTQSTLSSAPDTEDILDDAHTYMPYQDAAGS